jgi:hypothetical protein
VILEVVLHPVLEFPQQDLRARLRLGALRQRIEEASLHLEPLEGHAEHVREGRQEPDVAIVEPALLLRIHLEDAPHPAVQAHRHVGERYDAVLAQQGRDAELRAARQVLDDHGCGGLQATPRGRGLVDGERDAADDAGTPAYARDDVEVGPVGPVAQDLGALDPRNARDLRGRMVEQPVERHGLPRHPAEAGERPLVVQEAGDFVVESGVLTGHEARAGDRQRSR